MNSNTTKGWGENIPVYPLTQEFIDNMTPCDAVNPKEGKHHGLKIPDDFNLNTAAYEIIQVRMMVARGIMPWGFLEKYWPYKFEMPKYMPKCLEINGLSFVDPSGLAKIVHMDDPLDFPLSLKKTLTNPMYGGTANIKGPKKPYKRFLETVVDVNETITDFQKRYGHKVFEVKSFFGLIRPEEKTDLGPILTEYLEGCPCHGSIGQGHIALSQSGLKALNNDLELSEEQVMDGLYASYLWGQFRCLAGVHFGIDAILSILLVGGFDKYIRPEIKKAYKRAE